MPEKIRGRCPYCGRELEIPGELREFSCLYCGKRSHIDLLKAQEDFCKEDLLELASQLPQTLAEHSKLVKCINKKEYVPAFQAYEARHSTLLKRIDTLLLSAPMGIEEAADLLCTTFLDTLEKDLKEVKAYHSKTGRSSLLFEIKVVLALFLTPLVRKSELRMAEPFCTALHTLWLKRYPREEWLPGVYQEIVGGFRRKRLCFITTALCTYEGKADDCRELTTLRAFRDGWLMEQGGDSLIREYYELAPGLVTLMDHCDHGPTCYGEIRTRWLEPCLEALEEKDPIKCRDLYVDMVRTLCRRYLQS